MKAYTALILASIIISVSIMASPALASDTPSVGVKEGDWIEYSINVTGGTPPPKLKIDSFKIEVLDVEDTAIQANFTIKFLNGTFYSAVWKYNFTEGNTGGWTIIPANLNVGDTFYDDFKPGNVTVMGEEQKTVAGSTRTITHASDSKREIKEWDKATGVFTYAIEHPKNLTLTATAVATNMWSPQPAGVDLTVFYGLTIAGAVLAVLSMALIVSRRKGRFLGFASPFAGKNQRPRSHCCAPVGGRSHNGLFFSLEHPRLERRRRQPCYANLLVSSNPGEHVV